MPRSLLWPAGEERPRLDSCVSAKEVNKGKFEIASGAFTGLLEFQGERVWCSGTAVAL
jgi:hypothetical protein